MLKGFFLCAVHGEVCWLAWSTKPSLSWTAQCLAGVFLRICFPSGLGEGEGVEHLGEWEGSCCLLKESRQPMWQPAAPEERACVCSCVCMYVCLCNESPRHCLLPSRLPAMELFTWVAACRQAFFQDGKRRRRKGCSR